MVAARDSGHQSVDELRAELVADPPGQAALPRTTFRHDDGELGRNVDMFGDHLHPTVRYVGDRTVAWQCASAKLDLGKTPAQAAFTLTSVH